MSRRGIQSTFAKHVRRAAPALGLMGLVVSWVLARQVTVSAAQEPSADAEIRAAAVDFQRGVETLASDGMEGRGIETGGIRRAADWIEKQLHRGGLAPAFQGRYRQSLKVKIGVRLAEGNRLDSVAREDWTPLGFSSPGEVAGEVAFVGYGIEAPALGYREFDGIDLKGKIALMLRYEPQEKDEGSPFDGRKPSRFSALRYKALQARERGASAVIFATGPLQDEGKDKLPVLANDGPESAAGLPVIQVKTSVAQSWLSRAGVDLKAFQEYVDKDLTPRSLGETGITLKGTIALQAVYADADNVGGLIPGRGDLADEVVVLGAHYDHLGYGGQGSMRPNEKAIHNGADDNASGTMAALQIGERLRAALSRIPRHRGVLVLLFTGEEVGLAGSSFFVQHPPVPLDRIVAMINLDMVGRLRDGELMALGSETAPEWEHLMAAAKEADPALKIKSHGDGYGPSDQTSFYASGIPVLHFFTGAHKEYHTPEDDPKTLNAEGAAEIERFAARLIQQVAIDPARPTYVRTSTGPVMGGDSRGYGAYLGTIPDYRAMEVTSGGVLLSDVRKGGPADLAGIRGGDRIVEMAGTRIENLYDMTFALQDHKPGETIVVMVVRAEKRVALRATLGDRATMGRESASAPATKPAEAEPSHGGSAGSTPPSARPDASPPSTAGAFFEGRPGPDFSIGAGKPFSKSFEGEPHLKEIRQLTFGGENAEAYFSADGKHLIYQATPPGAPCDQEFVMDLATGDSKRVSSGKGRTTCGYFDYPESDRIVYATTEGGGEACPLRPDHSQGYVWALYDTYDIVEAKPDGSGIRRLTDTPGYDAEMTWCPRGGKMVFTSVRDGDLDLYVMDEEGQVRRLTRETGYDGGAFFSPDCSEIVWRASRPKDEELKEYKELLAKGLIRPHALEIYSMKADGSSVRQLTHNGAANFCPTFTADGRRILYASNAGSSGGREFDLYLIGKEGGDAEKVTTSPGFDGFPHFSPDGRFLVWASNRAEPGSHETNLFIARWAE
ncbi:MAG TPA: M28 family peptidase [Candidatus Polarisedimenticolia bacterium]|nr:M28 family peptidase [Candidatus Polarisedimenticolia bacterium]